MAGPVHVGVSPTRLPPAKPVIEDLESARMGAGSQRWHPEHEHWQVCQRKQATADARPVAMLVPGPVIWLHQSVARGSAAVGLDPGQEALESLVAPADRVTAPRAVQRPERLPGAEVGQESLFSGGEEPGQVVERKSYRHGDARASEEIGLAVDVRLERALEGEEPAGKGRLRCPLAGLELAEPGVGWCFPQRCRCRPPRGCRGSWQLLRRCCMCRDHP
jgi:hypothetical protein